ncbi:MULTISPECIES: hypothetical protein [unclassified Streptosporangium]|uniref:hypothetical protein n=1 Tax=Streptosporangium sp. NPDC005286 TaxID=3154463 RepID=UPI0033A336F3
MGRNKRTLAIGALVGFLAGGSGVAVAAAVADEVITACVAPNGSLRVPDSTGQCPVGQETVSWNQTGPAGPQGAPGKSSEAWSDHYNGAISVPETMKDVATVPGLPQGTYIMLADLGYSDARGGVDAYGIQCELQVSSGSIYGQVASRIDRKAVGEYSGSMAFNIPVTITDSTGAVRLRCKTYGMAAGREVHVSSPTLTAISTPKLTTNR